MVIIHVANIDTSVIGGVQVAVPEIVRAQSRYATVGLVNTHGDAIPDITISGFGGDFDPSAFPPAFQKPDIVVFHEVYRFEFIKIYRTLRSLGIPYIVMPHGCLSRKAQRKKRLKKLAANILFFKGFLRSARLISYLSEHERAMSAFPEYPSLVTGNGIRVPEARKESFSENGAKFLYIGRLEIEIKGLDLLLQAVKSCEARMREAGASLEIYGPNYADSHAVLKGMISELGIEDIVSLGKERMGEEKAKALLGADCFIQSSRTEGLPLGPIEALGCGLPCIVTEGVGLGEVIESYGAGIKCATSAEGISEAITRFLGELQERDAMSRSAVRLVEECYDMSAIAKKSVDVYADLIR